MHFFNHFRSKKIRCKYCKHKFKITYDDLMMCYNLNIDARYYFECPSCKGRLELSMNEALKLKHAKTKY